MVVIEFLDLIHKKFFKKEYDNYLAARKMLIKCSYSKKLRVVGIESDNPTELEYLYE